MARKAAIIGAGVIGAGWAARFLLWGWDVRVFDTDPDAEARLGPVLENARRALPGLSDRPMPPEGALSFHATLSETVADVDWIQESLPERLALKRKTYQKIQAHCREGAVIASSSAEFTPSALQGCATRPAQILLARPFDPVYLLPLVELAASPANPPELAARAEGVLQGLGMFPLHVTGESGGGIAGRLQQALWREALGLVREGIAAPEQIDEAIRMGPGLRWAEMGPSETSRRELEQARDTGLVAMMRALKWADRGVGAHLNRVDAARPVPEIDITRPIVTSEHAVPLDWTDYNGHMTESRYLQAFADATDRFMEIIGVDAAYLASGGSFFTVETHIRHLMEVHAGAALRVETLCLGAEGKTMHLFHRMYSGGTLLATGEHMLLHVSLETRRAAPPAAHIAENLAAIAAAHAALPRPRGVGRAVGQGR